MSYDVNVNAFPEGGGIEFTLDLPQLIFIPAYNKRPPFKRWVGAPAIAGPLLEFIAKHAEVQFGGKYPVDVSRVGYPKENSTS